MTIEQPADLATDPGRSRRRATGHDVVIVGGGLAGVAAAAVATHGGARVLLVERAGLGGRGHTVTRHRFRLNAGPHALYAAGAAAELGRRFGLPLAGGPPDLERAKALVGGRVEPFPFGATALARTGAVALGAKVGLARLLTDIRRGHRRPPAELSVAAWLDGCTDRQDVRRLLESLVRLGTYANAPELLSAEAAARQLALSARGGVRYLDGGWQTLIDGLWAAAQRGGAQLLLGETVQQVRAGAAHPWEVVTAEAAYGTATVIVAGVGPAAAAALLGARRPEWERLGPAVHVSTLDVGFAGEPAHRFLHGVDEPLYLSTHCPPAGLAPAGSSLVTAARYHRPDDQLGAEASRAQLQAHAARAGIDVEAATVQRYLHRMVVAHAMPLAANGGLAGRPPVTVADHPGLYVAGDWVGPTGQLADASAASAEAAARAALAHLAAGRVSVASR